MVSELSGKLERINTQLAAMLAGARCAVTGESDFGLEQVHALSAPIAEMAPVMARAAELRALDPEIAAGLDRYKFQRGELHIILARVRMMLLARRAQMEASRVHLQSVSHGPTPSAKPARNSKKASCRWLFLRATRIMWC
jgi:hypothetical protein